MKNLILALSVLFVTTVLNPQLYSQKRDHSKMTDSQMNLKQQLNLSEDQEKKIDGLRLSHEEAMIKFRSDLELKELEMRKLKLSEKLSRAEMINITKEISSVKNDMALARTNHQMDIYDLLDENQRKIWSDKQENFGHIKHKMRDKMHDRRNW